MINTLYPKNLQCCLCLMATCLVQKMKGDLPFCCDLLTGHV